MHPLEKKVGREIERHRLIGAGELVLVGVSAGPDSMALLHALQRLSMVGGFRLAAAYVDHGLRPAETGTERELVAATAGRLEIPWRSGTVAVRDYARREGLSLEHAARDLRYRFLAASAAQLGADCLAVAHTADDQAEELLLRLLRGTARKGLAGMDILRRGGRQEGEPETARGALKIIRPLLAVTKAEVLAYLAERGIPSAEDSSNRDLRFLRNRVRLELLPWLEERFNPNVRETLRRTAAVLRDEEELLEHLADEAYRQALVFPRPAGRGRLDELRLDLVVFNDQPIALRRRLLEKALWAMALRPAARQIEQLLAGAGRSRDGVVAHLAAGVAVSREGGLLKFVRGTPGPRRRGAR
ncbi:MAG TPA: tRNA lysidine(34) synthetase TilS [Desulfurivibrio alkaliphilus]|uniref:tRNA(Ile)-lysidine synthase n=1 Tax=Desulfurivibrio alkaliphilus TaxID=427923 RepID=A0A7C2XQ80_9BACT|nr:tRNA lysidine(34) synthetase TilS [Desulfurivibrio alkaliphilus]